MMTTDGKPKVRENGVGNAPPFRHNRHIPTPQTITGGTPKAKANTGGNTSFPIPPPREPTDVEKALNVHRSLIVNGVTDPDTLRKSKESVASARWARDSQLGPEAHAAKIQQRIDLTDAMIAKDNDKLALLQQQTLDSQAHITALQAERADLVDLKTKAESATPLHKAPLAHGCPVAFRELRERLEGELDTLSIDNPCDQLRHSVTALLNMFTDKFPDDADSEFRDCSHTEVTVADDDFKRFAEAANALDGIGDQPDKFNALQSVFRDAVKSTTERNLRAQFQDESQWSTNTRRRSSNANPYNPY